MTPSIDFILLFSSSSEDVLGATASLEVVSRMAVEGDHLLAPTELNVEELADVDIGFRSGEPVMSLNEFLGHGLVPGERIEVLVV